MLCSKTGSTGLAAKLRGSCEEEKSWIPVGTTARESTRKLTWVNSSSEDAAVSRRETRAGSNFAMSDKRTVAFAARGAAVGRFETEGSKMRADIRGSALQRSLRSSAALAASHALLLRPLGNSIVQRTSPRTRVNMPDTEALAIESPLANTCERAMTNFEAEARRPLQKA